MKKTVLFSAMTAMIFISACGNTGSPSNNSVPATGSTASSVLQTGNTPAAKAKKGTLLFFMNPYGAPCQMQNSILNEALPSIINTVDVTYIKTTNPEDTDAFYAYAIRGLPSMIIIDNNNTVIKRFSPGIQNSDTIVRTVKEL